MTGKDLKDQKMIHAKPDYKNWVPEGMVRGAYAGSAGCFALSALCAGQDFIRNKKLKSVVCGGLFLAGAGAGASAFWLHCLHRAFAYDGKRQMARQIIEGTAEYVTIPDIFEVLRGNGSDQDLFDVFHFYCHFISLIPELSPD